MKKFYKRLGIAFREVSAKSAEAFNELAHELRGVAPERPSIFFMGNGGSATIASHMATDWSNNTPLRGRALNDPAALTCIGNDDGYKDIFLKQLRWYAQPGDWLVAISSSGKSPNILAAAKEASPTLHVVTLSGFSGRNPLRRLGKYNFHVPVHDYRIVETAHLGILHALLEKVMK